MIVDDDKILGNLKKIIIKNRVAIVLGITLFIVSMFLRVWRVSSVPDIFGDEVLYNDIALQLPQYGQLMAFGSAWFAHPPLYFLMQSAFFQIAGISSVTLVNVFIGRLTSALYSSLTVLVVFGVITKLSDYRVGAVTAIVLLFEPYALKFSRIGILDTAAVLFILIAFYIFCSCA